MAFDFGTANTMQQEAIKTTEGPLLIIAGPGTGKTHTLVQRIVYLIQEKRVKPEEIMVATFTEKAAKELITRITNELLKKNIKANLNEMYVGTFHSICLRIIKEHLEFTNLKKNYRMLDSFDQTYLISNNFHKFKAIDGFDSIGLDAESWNNSQWRKCSKLGGYIGSLSEEMVDIDALSKDKDISLRALAECWKLYASLLKAENLVDFSTIQTECYRLLVDNQEILFELQEKIKYIMIDEYQDTNYIQEQLVFLLAGERQNICVVGDDDQGLYRFRGATIRNILEFPKNFPNGCKQVNLVENYRSEKDIIDFYNEWMQNTKGSWGSFDWGKFRFPKTIKGSKKDIYTGTAVMTCSAKNYDAWHKSIYEFIKDLKDSGKITDYNQIAFLCRSVTNPNVVNLINYLEDNGINVYSPRSKIFFDRLEIRQIIGCMLLCFPDYEKRMRARDFDYNPETLFKYFEDSCLSEVEQLKKAYPGTLGKLISKVRKKHANLKENTDYAFIGLFYQFLEFEPFYSMVNVGIGSGVIDERPTRNLSIFSSILGKFEFIERLEVFSPEKIEHASSEFFTRYLRVMIEEGIDEYEDDSEYAPSGCVSFMTIHQSKGMEFPVVIVGSMNQKPGNNQDDVMTEISEKYFLRKPFEDKENIPNYDFWRLYYTAFSRAQNLLVLSGKEMSGGSWPCPSRYFANMYNKLSDWKNVDITGIEFELVKPVNIKETYSFTSHIAVYENCSLQYKYFKELGFTQVRVGSTLFGTLVHETIEDVHRAAMRHEESTITEDNVRCWLDTNYQTLSKHQHSYLGPKQIEAAYNQVWRYVERATSGAGGGIVWSHIQEAEVEVSLVKEEYILKGQIDLIRGDGETVEIVDFKSEKVPEMNDAMLNRYRRQLEIYAYLVEQRDHKKVTKMHLYYTGEEEKSPMVSFDKSDDSIDTTIKEFDLIVEKIQNRDFSQKACNKKMCRECDFRYHCGEVKKK